MSTKHMKNHKQPDKKVKIHLCDCLCDYPSGRICSSHHKGLNTLFQTSYILIGVQAQRSTTASFSHCCFSNGAVLAHRRFCSSLRRLFQLTPRSLEHLFSKPLMCRLVKSWISSRVAIVCADVNTCTNHTLCAG